ncbi:MAG TPA: hypothetical protein DD670_08350 [Planctomycetaceae bacterium]|nr:hypothetical protein [Planctomycetaceae bacterium]
MGTQMSSSSNQTEQIREFFDQDSARYLPTRYTSEYRDCHQYSYIVRRTRVLDLLGQVGGRVLDVGCGPGVFTRDLLDRGCRIVACDISQMMIEQVRTRFPHEVETGVVQCHVGEIHGMDAEPESFDAAICIGVMAYIADEDHFLRKLASLLKPGGYAVIQYSKKRSPKALHEQYVYPLLTRLKCLVAGHRQSSANWDFTLRRYHPKQFNAVMASHGLQIEDSAQFDYTLPLLSSVATRANLWFAESMERGRRGILTSLLAGDYVARYRK